MSFRDKSNLKEYLRGNSGSKLIDEIKKDFENNRKAFFDNKPSGLSFRRDGFPFENDDIFGNKSDPGIKSHLEDLAKKHPEFAGDLKRPLWDHPKHWENAFTIPVSVEKSGDKPSTSQSEQYNEPQPNGNSAQPNEQRSNSDDRINEESKEPKRFTSKIEITPVNPYEENVCNPSSNQNQPGKSIPAATERQGREASQSPQTNRKQPQVRHIPIFVEGRSEPVVWKHTGEPQHFQPEQQIPVKRKVDTTDGTHPKQEIPIVEKPKPAGKPAVPPNAASPASSPAPSFKPNDPMHRIQEVQKEVENLTAQVEKFTGNLRTDKEYLYLDEMLTRNLIKLDTIEVEGNEKLRLARKEVIKNIQKSIALLESKVPLPNSTESQPTDEKMIQGSTSQSEIGNQNMEVEKFSQILQENQNCEGVEKTE